VYKKNKKKKMRLGKLLKGRKRPKGYGRTTTTGLTKGVGLARSGPNISLKRNRPIKGTKIRKIIKGYSRGK
tara:strand:- start:604 stop:816 length:213 start_codon:yes stop_codon:yes gene_type:complete